MKRLIYEWALRLIKEYPNCNMLIWQTAVMLDARRITDKCTNQEKYDKQINAWYELVLHDENEEKSLLKEKLQHDNMTV